MDKQVYLERNRLNTVLEKASRKPIISIIAGAGYGKTTAVMDYAKSPGVKTAWIKISERDNFTERFIENYFSALASIRGGAIKSASFKSGPLKNMGGKGKMEFPKSPQQMEIFSSYFRKLFAPNEKYIIIYDDLQLIREPEVLRFIEYSLGILPPNLSSILLSRSKPEINLEKFILKKQLSQIPETKLLFTKEEMLTFFKLNNLSPSPSLASEIYKETEGWAFAIHLAALSLSSPASKIERAYSLHALKANVNKLIEAEIMSSLTEEHRLFLIKLSLTENFNRDLGMIISGDPFLFGKLEKITSFIRYDNITDTCYIHHLFMEYLRERQKELSCEEKKEIWNKTAQWCEKNNKKMDAIINYEKAENYNEIGRIINDMPLLLSVNMAAFILDLFDRAKKDFEKTGNLKYIVMRNRCLASLSLLEQSRKETLENLPHYEGLPEGEEKHLILLICYINLASISLVLSVYTKKYDFTSYFIKAAMEAEISGHITKAPLNGEVLSSYVCRIMAPASEKDMEEYLEMLKTIVPYSVKAMGGCRYGLHELAMGEYCFFKGETIKAEEYLMQSLKKSSEKEQYEIENRSLFYLLRIYLYQGNKRKIEKVLKDLKSGLKQKNFPNRYSYYDIIMSWYFIQLKQKEQIVTWLRKDYEESSLVSGTRIMEKLLRAKNRYMEKHYPAALSFTGSKNPNEPFLFGDIEMKVLEALSLYKLKDKDASYISLEIAYNLSAPLGIIMPFIEYGSDMRSLTEAALRDKAKGLAPEWLAKIRLASRVYSKNIFPLIKEHANINENNLSSREKDVLENLSQGLTGKEMAASLSISQNTVKTIMKSIYNKLGTDNMAEAVRIASERKII